MKLIALLFTAAVANAASKSSATTSNSIPTSTACAKIGDEFASVDPSATDYPSLDPSLVLDCLGSVPLDVQRSSDFLDYVEPYWQFQSTLAYLKDPPKGYPLPGVDMLGGLAEIKENVHSGYYSSQWEFEKDLYALGNILPHDFHVNLNLPLVGLFSFYTLDGPLVSISSDGLELPELYFRYDLDKQRANPDADWDPSPLMKINGEDATLYLQLISMSSGVFQDNDANYNQVFYSLPSVVYTGSKGSFVVGGHLYGFPTDTLTYSFANGTDITAKLAATTYNDLSSIKSGKDLFNLVDLPSTSSTTTKIKRDTTTLHIKRNSQKVTSLQGYPTPVVIHPDGYVSGYFLNGTKTAVLVMQGFIDADESDPDTMILQQDTIKTFLAKCKSAQMEKLIVDVQGNGGGDIFNGYDAFKQLFPTIEPFGASRFRATPLVNYMGTIFSGAGRYNLDENYVYQSQAELDMNGKPFENWRDESPNIEIHGDNFTEEVRYNLTDVITEESGTFNVTGYLSNSNPPPAVFDASNIVMLMDGGCGSTCAVFAEMMKSQGGVRSIVFGGRPQPGPMQGVAGSKGAQVLTYGNIAEYIAQLPNATTAYLEKDQAIPNYPPAEYIPNIVAAPPLGDRSSFLDGGRFNLRNNMHKDDDTFTPLQFIYEASNCRLFYKKEDIYSIVGVWNRVEKVVWGNGTCVEGSSVEADNTMPMGAYDTVPFGDSALPNVEMEPQPGLLPIGTSVTTWTSESGGRYEDAQKAFVEAIYNGIH
ncbi:peptidase S41 family protein [Rutstroemia sp. NJR-2017a WRK4]|nr:peptidase S41 family protein [Rutstroemia sp. NJR-2017a WRK4]